MNKMTIPILILIGILLLSLIIPGNLSVAKEMNPVDGNTHTIGTTTSPPTLDGIVKVGSSWHSSQYVGNAYVHNTGNSVAEVYAVVEVDSEDNFLYLWLGVDMKSPYTLEDNDGQWVRIDWDQDGTLDYEDHTGWADTNGADSADGCEWMIPWGQVRVNPGDEPYQMEPQDVGNSFDILIHVEAHKDGKSYSALFPDGPGYQGKFQATTFTVELSPPPPTPGDTFGVRSMGFWKHQMRTATGEPGHQHIATDDLLSYIQDIADSSDVPELQALDDDSYLLINALAILEPEDSSIMYDKAVQQLLAVWLNYEHNGDLEVLDTDDDGILDLKLSDAIAEIEDILTDPDATKDDLTYAKNLADAINNSGINVTD